MATVSVRSSSFSKLMLLSLAAVLVAAGCSKGSNTSASSSAAQAQSVAVASTAPTSAANTSSAASGAKIYASNCASCHQINGKGVPGMFPPLAGNPVVTGNPEKVIHIVKYGLTGQVQVAGTTYNGQMPAWSSQLSETAIASAITYIRSSWGNHASAVLPAQVTAVSK